MTHDLAGLFGMYTRALEDSQSLAGGHQQVALTGRAPAELVSHGSGSGLQL